MRTLTITAVTILALLMAGCKEEKKEPAQERVVETTDPKTGIITLRSYNIDDTITINGKLYNYSCRFEPVDTMPVLINSQGLEYRESRVSISIKQGDSQLFSKTYYKRDFCEWVPTDFLKTSTMVGVNYNYMKRDSDHTALYFILTVGDPDETSDNMAISLELKVAPDGSHTIKKAENLETEPLRPGLNIDPSEDAV